VFESLDGAIAEATAAGVTVAEIAMRQEETAHGRSRAEIRAGLSRALGVMRQAAARGLEGKLVSVSGLVGGDAVRLAASTGPLGGTVFVDVLARAMAVQEMNAAMGVIVAAPTAGGAGVLPGVLLGLAQRAGRGDDALVDALATAGLIGAVIAQRASLSGAEGGCQAETGAAAGMASGAATEMLGGSPTQVGHAVSLAMQGTLGLVCDPLGGLVEVPCVHRNVTGAAIALAAIELALAGVAFPIPADEVIDTMGEIGRRMDVRYRETAGGGLAATPTGRRLARERLVRLTATRAATPERVREEA